MATPISSLPLGSKSLANQIFLGSDGKLYVGKDEYYALGGLDDMDANTIKGRISTSGTPQDLTAAQVRTIINVANGATANQTDAYLLNRANHTGSQAISTITNLQTTLNGKQATLVSGTNIKTINGASILGSGNIVTPNDNTITQIRSNTSSYLTGNVTFSAGTNVTLSQSGQTITINATGGSSVDLVTAGSSTIGAVRYAGTTKTSGQFYGGTSAPTNITRLNYDGNLHVQNLIGSGASDKRLKENITLIDNPLERVSQLRGVGFDWLKNDDYTGHDYGLIAQDLEKVLPSAVVTNPITGIKSIKIGNQVIALLVEAVKELSKKVKKLENGIS